MKRTIIIILALLSVIALAGCKNEPETPSQPAVIQTVVRNRTTDITTMSIQNAYWKAGNSEAQYKLLLEEDDTTATLKIRSYDHMTSSWPEEWITYTGTYTMEKYDKVISETETRKEITETWMYTVTFSSVDDPMYEATVHVYDGMFDVRFVSGYGNSTTNSGGYSAGKPDGCVVAFEVTEHKDGAPSTLIGVGNWTK